MEADDIAAVVRRVRRGDRRWRSRPGSTASRSTPASTASCASSCPGLTNQRERRLRHRPAPLRPRGARRRPGRPSATGVLGLRLSCDELAPWAGITPEAAAEIAVALAAAGRLPGRGAGRRSSRWPPPGPTATTRRASTSTWCAPSAPRSPVPRARRSPRARSSTSARPSGPSSDGRCDGVEMTRAQIADPDLVRQGRGRPSRTASGRASSATSAARCGTTATRS